MTRRQAGITAFVLAWTLVFHYETLRLNYLTAWLHRPLPKLPLLFPPAGWIMFYRVDREYGFAEVYGLRGGRPERLDPHRMFETRAVGYDNIRRNMLVSVLSRDHGPEFCAYLRRKFPDYEAFAVMYARHPDVVELPDVIVRDVAYRCGGKP